MMNDLANEINLSYTRILEDKIHETLGDDLKSLGMFYFLTNPNQFSGVRGILVWGRFKEFQFSERGVEMVILGTNVGSGVIFQKDFIGSRLNGRIENLLEERGMYEEDNGGRYNLPVLGGYCRFDKMEFGDKSVDYTSILLGLSHLQDNHPSPKIGGNIFK